MGNGLKSLSLKLYIQCSFSLLKKIASLSSSYYVQRKNSNPNLFFEISNLSFTQANSTTGDGRVDEQIELLSERITGLVNEAERLGSEGNVEEAQGLSKLCDKLREERDQLRKANENSVWHQVSKVF